MCVRVQAVHDMHIDTSSVAAIGVGGRSCPLEGSERFVGLALASVAEASRCLEVLGSRGGYLLAEAEPLQAVVAASAFRDGSFLWL